MGRINELTDMTHGEKSAEIYDAEGGTDNIVRFMIQYHCIEDGVAEEDMKKLFPQRKWNDIWTMYNILKDVDALDRVRFGFATENNTDGLDVRYLRRTHPEAMVFFAVRNKGDN